MLGTSSRLLHRIRSIAREQKGESNRRKESNLHCPVEVCFWNPDENGHIRRNARAPNTIPNLSRFTEVVLHQGRAEQFFLDAIKISPQPGEPPLTVERGVAPTSLVIDADAAEDEDAHPVTVTLRRLSTEESTPAQRVAGVGDGIFRSNLFDGEGGKDAGEAVEKNDSRTGEEEEEVVKAKYVVGCDGAHSWTRKALGKGFEMVGETSDFIW